MNKHTQDVEQILKSFYCQKCGGSLAERVFNITPHINITEGAIPITEQGEEVYVQKYSCSNGHEYAKKSTHRIVRNNIKAALDKAYLSQVLEVIIEWCQCEDGYIVTGGMAMEDDLVEKEPCDECAELRTKFNKLWGSE